MVSTGFGFAAAIGLHHLIGAVPDAESVYCSHVAVVLLHGVAFNIIVLSTFLAVCAVRTRWNVGIGVEQKRLRGVDSNLSDLEF